MAACLHVILNKYIRAYFLDFFREYALFCYMKVKSCFVEKSFKMISVSVPSWLLERSDKKSYTIVLISMKIIVK